VPRSDLGTGAGSAQAPGSRPAPSTFLGELACHGGRRGRRGEWREISAAFRSVLRVDPGRERLTNLVIRCVRVCVQKSGRRGGGQVCQICGDGVGTTAEGDVFAACDVCGFPVCRPCYEYERKDGTQACPQCKTKYKRHKGNSTVPSTFHLFGIAISEPNSGVTTKVRIFDQEQQKWYCFYL
jgi:hypothetical protein